MIIRCFVLMWLVLASAAASDPFTLVIKTDNPGTSSSVQFTLPLDLGSVYDFTLDWGDGTALQTITSATSPTHTYASAGTYTLQITELVSGGFPRILFNGGGDGKKLLQIANWGNATWSTMNGAFDGCSNLVITATDAATAQTGGATSFRLAWAGCSSLTSFPALNTAGSTEFLAAWEGCSSLTSFPLINTSAATDFTQTWYGCSGLATFPLLNTANVTNLDSAWLGCSALTAFPLLDCHAVIDFSNAWQGCSSLTTFPLLDTSAGQNFTGSWSSCSSLSSFPLLDIGAGTTVSRAWANCHALTTFPLLNTAASTDFSIAWSGCTGLTSFPLLNTAAGTNFHSAWQNCSSLTAFPLLDTAAGLDFSDTWDGCTALTTFATLNMGNLHSAGQCFQHVTLAPASYSALLIALALQNSNHGVTLDGGFSTYNTDATSARTTQLVGALGWTITDGGIAHPVITSTLSTTARVGTAFAYQITATNLPTGYGASGLPAGLVVDPANGLVSGTPTGAAGTVAVVLSATNANTAPGVATLNIVVAAAATGTATAGATSATASGTATAQGTSSAGAGSGGGGGGGGGCGVGGGMALLMTTLLLALRQQRRGRTAT